MASVAMVSVSENASRHALALLTATLDAAKFTGMNKSMNRLYAIHAGAAMSLQELHPADAAQEH